MSFELTPPPNFGSDRLFDVGSKTLEDGVENTTGLARGDHVDVEIVEGCRVFAHRLGERGPALHILSHLEDDFLKDLVVLLLTEDVEALHQRQAGVDHHRELAGKDREVFRLDATAELRQGDLLAFLLDGGDDDLLATESGDYRIFTVADEDAGLCGAVAVAAFPLITGHLNSSLLALPLGRHSPLPRPY